MRLPRFVMSHARAVVALAALTAAGSGVLAAGLELRTDLAELLPDGEPAVAAIRHVQARLGGLSALVINVEADDPAASRAFASALAERIGRLPPALVGLARADVRAELAWFRAHSWLYVDPRMLAARQAPAGSVANWLSAVAERLPDGTFATLDGHTHMVLVLPPGGMFEEHAGERLVQLVRREIAAAHPERAGVRSVGLSGEIAAGVEERASVEHDLVWATCVCIALVCLVVVLYYRRVRALPLMAVPASLGTLAAFAIARLAFGYLNSSTAFLGPIIIGNGINFAIVLLARYEEERGERESVERALACAVGATLRPTGTAAAAAAVSYGSLLLTRFRGFSQFGVIGGAGMTLAWIATITVLPAAIWLLDRKDPSIGERRRPRELRRLARLPATHPRLVTAIAVALLGLLALRLPHYLADPFEYSLTALRSSRGGRVGDAAWQKRNEEVFGRALAPLVALAPSSEEAPLVAEALAAADRRGGAPKLKAVFTARDLLPDPAEQERRMAALRAVRARMGEARADAFGLPAPGPVVTPADLPPLVRRVFVETDGTFGRVVLAVPDPAAYQPTSGHDLIQVAARLGRVTLPDGREVEVAGTAMVFGAMMRAIARDAPRTTLGAAVGVALLVLLLSGGPARASCVLVALAAGVLATVGAAAWLPVRLNFLNFIALPITIGIGVDYAINVVARTARSGLFHAIATTGGAVALCSATTVIGYGSLLLADNRGVRSFAELAVLGEIACLATALVGLPAVLALWRRP
jgi:predicted RND superfamily exporter protein